MGLTGSLAPLSGPVAVTGISELARLAAKIQVLVFVCATLIFIISGVSSLISFKGEEAANTGTAPDADRAPRGRRR